MYGKGEMETGRQIDRINMKCLDKKRQTENWIEKESTGAKGKLEEAEIEEIERNVQKRRDRE